ncbi:MAG: chemotaxis protein CheW [bacterium]|nr:chemotaxis protein CheW [bacterium]
MTDDDMLVGFLDEAREHLSTIEPDLLTLESNPKDQETINRLFRSVHSIKGGAGFFGLETLSKMAHVMENLMSKARAGGLTLGQTHIDALLSGLDKLNQMVAEPKTSNDIDISNERDHLESLAEGKEAAAAPAPTPSAAPATPAAPVPPPVAAPAVVEEAERTMKTSEFDLPQKEIEWVAQHDMNLYAVSVYLNRDIMSKGKTPYQFISDLEELGRFVDSYLDTDDAESLEGDVDEEDLRFTFVFASIMAPAVAAEGLAVREDQLQHLKLAEIKDGKVRVTLPAKVPKKAAPAAAPAPVAAPPAVIPEPEPEPEAESDALPLSPPSGMGSSKVLDTKKVKTDESIRVGVAKLNKLVDLAGELVLVRNQLLQAGEKESKKSSSLMSILQGLNMVTTELQEEILNTRMQAVQTVFGKFPRLVRELGRSLGKDINLVTEGGEVELDKTVLEALSDPLTHMIRNTADHGIEMPDERKQAGKIPQGKLLLKAYHESGQVIIEVSDDGRGIDGDAVAASAVKKGVLTQADALTMTDREKQNLIFHPGFSMAKQVSNVSGRGVGMDVVRSNIEQIGGSVDLRSKAGQGTSLKLTLPLTMAIVSCLIVESEGQRFAIPQVNLEELVMLKPEDYEEMLGYVQDREVLRLRGDLLPLVSLAEGLGIKESQPKAYRTFLRQLNSQQAADERKRSETKRRGEERSDPRPYYNLTDKTTEGKRQEAVRVLIISVGINKVGVVVNSIVGSEEIVVKPMPEYLQHLTFFSGATILGDGTVAMIIDTLGFVQHNQLSLTEQRMQGRSLEQAKKSVEEAQSLLIFDNGTEERFAITIPLIQRVDEIELSQIQRVSGKDYLEYRGEQMRLLHLSDYLDVGKPEKRSEKTSIIIPKETHMPVGIVINRVIDTKTMYIDVSEGAIHGPGILGSTLIDGKITLLLDLYALLELGEPDALHRVHFNESKVKASKILVIEDTPLFQTIVREYLSSVGFEVDVEENGKLGVEAIERKHYDLVLCDIEMPVMDGFDVIRTLRANEKFRDLKVIALTSLDDDKLIKEGLAAGFNEWMIKLDKEKMLATVNQYLN